MAEREAEQARSELQTMDDSLADEVAAIQQAEAAVATARESQRTIEREGDIRQDVEYRVEVSTDMDTWVHGDPHTVTVLDTPETLEVYSATALDDEPRQFIRLTVLRK